MQPEKKKIIPVALFLSRKEICCERKGLRANPAQGRGCARTDVVLSPMLCSAHVFWRLHVRGWYGGAVKYRLGGGVSCRYPFNSRAHFSIGSYPTFLTDTAARRHIIFGTGNKLSGRSCWRVSTVRDWNTGSWALNPPGLMVSKLRPLVGQSGAWWFQACIRWCTLPRRCTTRIRK